MGQNSEKQWMKEYIGVETAIQGSQWGALHGGYFSDPVVAEPLISSVMRAFNKNTVDVVADLGGGTGFLLSQLKSLLPEPGVSMVDIDCSNTQLALSEQIGIKTINSSIDSFNRKDFAMDKDSVLFIMRSVFHYFGKKGLPHLLNFLHKQARTGELFVHQSASFDHKHHAACLNALYEHMHTHKWYPDITDLQNQMNNSGWQTTERIAGPALLLTSEDLGIRYGLTQSDIHNIRHKMEDEFGEVENVFELTPTGFKAYLHYHIYTCMAI